MPRMQRHGAVSPPRPWRLHTAGSRRLLLSTPLGARGLDIPECSHVYLFDLPSSAEDYLHAAGRSGRIGNSGTATVLCAEKELFRLRRIGNALGIDFEDAAPPRT
ncbi:ATP-dependent RNA helicase [Emiliania huxleyi CCMP1516]|uniref:Helicase C-terminal domain-containing protein n=2 Tax=Emiliania huxleyi TaxID=2903 RepID=A0A0D3K2Q8_EMIH1|nr:ATP-dependent RNA helicase [Emiliania huxleyi CCMP1516]EOD30043.1 ATP-dependent RNA helicase [Emiliania huxleyi CCMP1516]|eukprot:XP_005782472.1 ATP-dependent RNA helicase [Emiliania huxleyi CCMP1516]